jgi:hypothetical protein
MKHETPAVPIQIPVKIIVAGNSTVNGAASTAARIGWNPAINELILERGQCYI